MKSITAMLLRVLRKPPTGDLGPHLRFFDVRPHLLKPGVVHGRIVAAKQVDCKAQQADRPLVRVKQFGVLFAMG